VNVKEYISSGVIESYVLGLATGAEREEFEQMCKQYPEIAEARTAFELALEEQLLQDAPAPPAFLKDKIQQAITNEVTIADTNGVEYLEMGSCCIYNLVSRLCLLGGNHQ
jgi:hypothetical protein